LGEKGAQIAWGAVGEIDDARRRAETFVEKGEKLPGVAAISFDRARRQAPLMGEMDKPCGGSRSEVGCGGEGGELGGGSSVAHEEDGAMKRLSGGCVSGNDLPSQQRAPMQTSA
jgi:hypothetical protein